MSEVPLYCETLGQLGQDETASGWLIKHRKSGLRHAGVAGGGVVLFRVQV